MLSISVVTPSYNQGRFLRKTMESIHSQGYPALEHVVIDGGSTDDSVEVIRSYEESISYWVSETDDGQTDALAKGFAQATGDILCWLNSDDLFESSTLWEVAGYFEAHPHVDFVYGDSTWIDEEGRVIKPKKEHGFSRFVWMYDHDYIPQPSAFWRRRLYEQVGGVNPSFDLAMDSDLWIRFADRTKPFHVRRPWSRMRFYGDQKTTRLSIASAAEAELIRARYGVRKDNALKSIMARALRVGWKTATGCYSPSEFRTHAKTFVGGLTWEEEQLRRTGGN
jgi:glycosyltransferase involved in cell wall biosynthesis